MKTIHKFRLDCGKEPTTLKLREGYRVVRCEYLVSQKGVYIWVEQPLNVDIPLVERQFVVALSGDPVPMRYQYLDTALDTFGPEAFHVFELPQVAETARSVPESAISRTFAGNSSFQRAGTA